MPRTKKLINAARQGILIAGITLLVTVLLEAACFVVLTALDLKNVHSLGAALANRKMEWEDAWCRRFVIERFDPLTQIRQIPDGKYLELKINSFGFIGNGANDPDLNAFPEKPRNVRRILLLGGSAAAGLGVESNQDTIAAFLERMLNKSRAGFGEKYQVLNFGYPGGYTGSELMLLLLNLVYLEPDAVICYDGYNDAWNSLFEHRRWYLKHGIINWADFSYQHFILLNSIMERSYKPLKMFTYSSVLISRLTENTVNIEKFMQSYPFYNLSSKIQNKYPLLDNVTFNNLDAMASYCSMNNIKLFSYLQPTALNDKKKLTETEKNRINKWFTLFLNRDQTTSFPEYQSLFVKSFSALEQRYMELGRKYAARPDVHFFSLQDIFVNTSQDVYRDDCHLIREGNRIVAQRMMEDLLKMAR